MRRNERGISLIVLVIAIAIMAVLVAVGVVLVLNKQNNKIEKEDTAKFLKDMKEVTYVNLEYGGKTVELNNELAEILLDVDRDSIKGKSLSKTEHSTGEQAYSFIFFNEDDEELYRLQFTQSSEEIFNLGDNLIVNLANIISNELSKGNKANSDPEYANKMKAYM